MTKIVTGREIWEGIKKNGYPWVQKIYIDKNWITGEIYGACALGQASLNLGINIEKTGTDMDNAFYPYLREITEFNDWWWLTNNYEDELIHHSYPEIVSYAKDVLTPVWDTEFEFQELSDE